MVEVLARGETKAHTLLIWNLPLNTPSRINVDAKATSLVPIKVQSPKARPLLARYLRYLILGQIC